MSLLFSFALLWLLLGLSQELVGAGPLKAPHHSHVDLLPLNLTLPSNYTALFDQLLQDLDDIGSYPDRLPVDDKGLAVESKYPTFMPPNHPRLPQLKAGYAEALVLATWLYQDIKQDDPSFVRYFRPSDYAWVKGVLATISGTRENNEGGGTAIFHMYWSLWVGDVVGRTDCKDNGARFAYTLNSPEHGDPPYQAAKTGICPVAFEDPPLADIGLETLGDYDSENMRTLSSTILHEMMHIAALISRVPGVEDLLDPKGEKVIVDYERAKNDNSVPPNGYGPYNAWALRQYNNRRAKSNADNYRWYALSRFFTKRFNKSFKAALTNG